MIGGWEIFIILIAGLVLFGGKKLPELAKNLGKGPREFRRASSGLLEEEAEKPCDHQCDACDKKKQ